MLAEEVTGLIGQSLGTRTFDVEKGAIRKFADAVDDRNPLYWDEEYARNSRYRAMIAPPGFFGWPTKWAEGSTFPLSPESSGPAAAAVNPRAVLEKAGYGRILDGGIEYEFLSPIRAGDTLTVSAVIKSVIERAGRTGKMVFMGVETTYTNQHGEVVARARGTSIHR